MARKNGKCIVLDGVVREALKDSFLVEILPAGPLSESTGGPVVKGYLCGRIRINLVRVVPGDRVRLEMSPYDTNLARITYRYR